jgi:DNA replication protein DnaC
MREQLRVHLEERARTAVKRSCIFPVTTLDTYDFARPTSIDKDLVERAASLDFVRERTNVVFVGPSGVGKTHLANALGFLACVEGYRVRFALAADLVNDLVASQARNTLSKRLSAWTAYDLLLIDELGYLSFDSRGADLLYQVFNKRYMRGATVVTTNLAFKDWGQLFHNAAAATAIADRLVHKGLLVSIKGPSSRPGATGVQPPDEAA